MYLCFEPTGKQQLRGAVPHPVDPQQASGVCDCREGESGVCTPRPGTATAGVFCGGVGVGVCLCVRVCTCVCCVRVCICVSVRV
jgi:hypothetical protein